MSGGVDSTVAAMLALRDGFDLTGAVMILHRWANSDASDADAAAKRLRIPFYEFDFTEPFAEHVVSPFICAYQAGRTPNPCIDCNRRIKFGLMLDKARELGKQKLITGHYARISLDGSGRYLLKKGADASKDQSYVLYTLRQDQLSCAIFPLGDLTKQEVRDIASDAGLHNASRRESQDICFIPDGDYVGFMIDQSHEAPRLGRFVDEAGKDLGPNKGVACYTIGQRRGLGLSAAHPLYVLDIRPEDDTVVVGKEASLYSKTLVARDINLIAATKLDSPIRARAKIRYTHTEQPATIIQTDDDALRIEFDEPQRAITKGQAVVIYDGETVVGGGTIAACGPQGIRGHGARGTVSGHS